MTVVLIFADTTSIADFVLLHKISNVIIGHLDFSVEGKIAEDNIVIACTRYGAQVKKLDTRVSEAYG
ncbi:MAG TPA: hypothetical protein VNR87_16890 [Flavisolibacter sp.]|nr:hypothetical protein [Flavisolibacter sp.]